MRSEIKYLVPDDLLPALRRSIASMVHLDKHAAAYADTGYTVRSIYLDSPRLRYYHEKIEGIKDRKKLRVRAYNLDESHTFLEIKRKYNTRIKKTRAALPFINLPAVFEGGQQGNLDGLLLDSKTFSKAAGSFKYHLHKENLRCINLVVYEREAFEGRFDNTLRITFDKNLRSRLSPHISLLFSEADMQQILPGHFILEIKYNYSFPRWLTPVLAEFKLQKQSLSKYCMSLENAHVLSRGKNRSRYVPTF